jgi:uncharacterized RDD family membrane protein YckC
MPCLNHPAIDEGLARCLDCGGSFCPDCLVAIGGALRCGPCKTEWALDRLSGVPDTLLDLASIWRRFLALAIDGMLIGIPYLTFMALVFSGLKLSPVWSYAIPFVSLPVGVLYHGWMLAVRGQTLGKMALGIQVVSADGAPLRPGQAWGRAVLQRAFFSCLSLLDYLPALFTPERTCIHDLAARTRVIQRGA